MVKVQVISPLAAEPENQVMLRESYGCMNWACGPIYASSSIAKVVHVLTPSP